MNFAESTLHHSDCDWPFLFSTTSAWVSADAAQVEQEYMPCWWYRMSTHHSTATASLSNSLGMPSWFHRMRAQWTEAVTACRFDVGWMNAQLIPQDACQCDENSHRAPIEPQTLLDGWVLSKFGRTGVNSIVSCARLADSSDCRPSRFYQMIEGCMQVTSWEHISGVGAWMQIAAVCTRMQKEEKNIFSNAFLSSRAGIQQRSFTSSTLLAYISKFAQEPLGIAYRLWIHAFIRYDRAYLLHQSFLLRSTFLFRRLHLPLAQNFDTYLLLICRSESLF